MTQKLTNLMADSAAREAAVFPIETKTQRRQRLHAVWSRASKKAWRARKRVAAVRASLKVEEGQ
jgi:hypothetical protein